MSLLMSIGTQYSIVYGVKYSHEQTKHAVFFIFFKFFKCVFSLSKNRKMWRNQGNYYVKDFEGYAYVY